jgi:hypothetical protein
MNKETAQIVIKDMIERGAHYAEIYYEHVTCEYISNFNNLRISPNYYMTQGVSLRAFIDKNVFSCSINDDLSLNNIIKNSEMLLGSKKIKSSFEFNEIDVELQQNSISKYDEK